MHETIKKMAQAFARQREQRRRACAAFTALAILVSLTTTYMLVQPANTMAADYVCGMEAHTHSEDCYRLICGYEDETAEDDIFFEEDAELDEEVTDAESAEDNLEGEDDTTSEPSVDEEPVVEPEIKEETKQEETSTEEEPKVEEPVVTPEVSQPAEEEVQGEPEQTEDSATEETPSVTEQPEAPTTQEAPVVEEKVEVSVVEGAPATPAAPVTQETPAAPAAASETGTDSGSEAFSGTMSMAMVVYTGGAEAAEVGSEPAAPSEPAPESTDTTSAPVETPVEAPAVETPVVEEPVEETESVEEPTAEAVVDEDPIVEEEPSEETEATDESADEEITSEDPADENVEKEPDVEQEVSSGGSAGGHVHTADCYELICEKEEHVHDDSCLNKLVLLPEGIEIPEGYDDVYEAEAGEFRVLVYAPAEAELQGAELKVELLKEGSDEHATVEQTLDAMEAQEIAVNVGGVMSEEDLEEAAFSTDVTPNTDGVFERIKETVSEVLAFEEETKESEEPETAEETGMAEEPGVETELQEKLEIEEPVASEAEQPVEEEMAADNEETLTVAMVHYDNGPAEESVEEENVSEAAEIVADVEAVTADEVSNDEPATTNAADVVRTLRENGYTAMDIYFVRDGEEIEPAKPVFVCINVKNMLPGLFDPDSVTVLHLKEVTETKPEAEAMVDVPVVECVELVVDNTEETGVVTTAENAKEATLEMATVFAVDSFSIFVVSGVTPDIDKIDDGDELSMVVNEEVFLEWQFDIDEDGDGKPDKYKPGNEYSATYKRGVWAITEGSDLIEIETYPCVGGENFDSEGNKINTNEAVDQYWYAKVKALKSELQTDAEGIPLKDTDDGSDSYRRATITYTYYTGDTDKDPTGRKTYSIQIEVADEGFWIEDKVATTGCLVPAGSFNSNENIVKYRWLKNDVPVAENAEALSQQYTVENGINIAVDKGGITAVGQEYNTYSVEGLDKDGEVVTMEINGKVVSASASFTPKYNMRIINGGFEYPQVPAATTQNASIHRQYANGHEGIYWMTTGTGVSAAENNNNGTDRLGDDIEIFTDRYGSVALDANMAKTYSGDPEGLNYIGTHNNLTLDQDGHFTTTDGTKFTRNRSSAEVTGDDDHQAAELNCEAYGALYQDVLTNPGATLYWGVEHAARYKGDYLTQDSVAKHPMDHMCIIIMSTEDARHIVNKDDIDKLLGENAANYRRTEDHEGGVCDCGLPEDSTAKNKRTGDPFFYADLDENTTVRFQIWESMADYTKWVEKTGEYKVPDGQFSTRFFFAATVSTKNNLAGGNFINNVYFSEDLPYEIKYYTQEDATQPFVEMKNYAEEGVGAPGETIVAGNVNKLVEAGYSLAFTKLNDSEHGRDISFSLRPDKNSNAPILELYFIKSGISVTKNVQGLDDDYTQEQIADILKDYVVYIDLYSDEACTEKVAEAELSFLGGNLSPTVLFNDISTGKQFAPKADTDYWAKERFIPAIDGYYSTVTELTAVKVEVGTPATADVSFTNTYATGAVLPNTGGMGTNLFTTLGIVLMLGAGVLLLDQRRRNNFSAG